MPTDALSDRQIAHYAHTPVQSPASRIAFRFCFVYFGLYCLGTQIITSLLSIPSVEIPDLATLRPMRSIVFGAARLFRVSPAPNFGEAGSGDRMFDWLLVFCLLVIAVIATAVWSYVDRKRESYATLAKWFRVFLRFALAGQLISYGLVKAVPLQMPYPYLGKLVEPFGDFSPMGVLWSSIGASPAYETFAGCAELMGGLLLIFPRTTMLGALISLTDMIQVFMLNMTYDVPVKLLSFHLILLSLFLLAPDLRRLARFFLLDRKTEPSTRLSLFSSSRANRIAFACQIVLGLWLLGTNVYASWSGWHNYGGGSPKSPLYGIWDVDQFSIDGEARPPLLGDSERWHRVIFEMPSFATFQRMDESLTYFGVDIKENDKTIALSKNGDKSWSANFTFQQGSADQLTLDGTMDHHHMHMDLKLFDRNKFLVVNRGFHWIQESPFNR